MKKYLKLFVPPIVTDLLKMMGVGAQRSQEFQTYDQALKHCSSAGYQADEIVRTVVRKNVAFRDSVLRDRALDLGAVRTMIGVALSMKPGKRLRVLDFGGGGGYHHTVARSVLDDRVPLSWCVVETSAMAREARQMESGELKFFDNIEAARQALAEVDLVFSSGTLHCCPDPEAYLRELLELNAEFLYITRTGLTDSEKQVASVQVSKLSSNGPGPMPAGMADMEVRYPNVFVPKESFERMLLERYEIRFRMVEERDVYRVGVHPIHLHGYFCTRRSR